MEISFYILGMQIALENDWEGHYEMTHWANMDDYCDFCEGYAAVRYY